MMTYLDGGWPQPLYTQWVLAMRIACAMLGIGFLALMVMSNRDTARRLRTNQSYLRPVQYARRRRNLYLRWAAAYFVATTELFSIYLCWSLWHYQFGRTVPYEAIAFDALRISGFIVLAVLWVVDMRR
jgi:hypothetical protein